MLLWTLGFIYLFVLVFSLFPDIYSGVESLDHMVDLFLVLGGTSILFSIVVAPIYIPIKSVQGSLSSTFSPKFIICKLFDDNHSATDGRCIISSLGLLWIMLLWTFMYKFLFGHVFSITLDICLGAELLGHIVTLCLTLWGTTRLFFKVAVPFYNPTSKAWGFSFFLTSPIFVIGHLFY